MIDILEGSSISCGVSELVGVNDRTPHQVLKAIISECELCPDVKGKARDAWDYYGEYTPAIPAFLSFSDIYRESAEGGQALADYIKKNKLGPIVQTTIRTNQNSGNRIRAWIWGPNATKLRAWWKKEEAKKENNKNERKSRTGRSKSVKS